MASQRRHRGISISSIRNLPAELSDALPAVGHGAVRVAEAALNKDVQPGVLAATAEVANQALPVRTKSTSNASKQHLPDGHETTEPVLIEEVHHEATWHSAHRREASINKSADDLQKGHTISIQQVDSSSRRPVSSDGSGAQPVSKDDPPQRTKAALKWLCTPTGFLLTIYGLNIVAWGGMLFLLLCKASPAMCWYTDDSGQRVNDCDSNDSPRKIWIEIDSQILNALFCVTGLGLIPWRVRDLYYLLSYRLTSERRQGRERKLYGLRMLASHYRAWIRLPVDENVATGGEGSKGVQLSVVNVQPTALWKVDVFVWCQIANTVFQIGLCYWMWAWNRINRPPWATGLFVGLACGVAGVGGLVSYFEGRRVAREEAIAQQDLV